MMESPKTNSEPTTVGAKRKRTPITDSAAPPTSNLLPNSSSSNNVTQINYLVKARPEKLRLIEGDSETFVDVLGMIDDYEGVLQRHESLAANLGAKLVGPLLLKSFEKLFDGPIKVLQASFAFEQSPVSWIDIVTFARTNSSEFVLTDSAPGVKSCRFWIKGGQVEISEDDYRLIVSGAPERMIPTQPIAEDESAELGTLNILEARLAILIKKADAVASKARQLNYHLKGRKTAVMARKANEQSVPEGSERTFSPQPQPFPVLNSRSPASGNVEAAKIQQQLLEQFLTTPPSHSRRTSVAQSRPKATRIINSVEPAPTQPVTLAPTATTNFHAFPANPNPPDITDRRLSQAVSSSSDDGADQYRILMATRIDKLAKGDIIFPPCDRCRRLKFDCTKHLTACTACTKKHAKCAWKDVREGELDFSSNIHTPTQGSHQHHQQQAQAQAQVQQLQIPSENGLYVPVSPSSHLDPGLRSPLPSSMMIGLERRDGDAESEERERERIYREREERFGGGGGGGSHSVRLSAEQALLTQIAGAAAAAGHR